MAQTATATRPIGDEFDESVSLVGLLVTEFSTAGITSAHKILEQISLLLFIRFLDYFEFQDEQSGQPFNHRYSEFEQNLRWSNFKNLPAEEMLELFDTKVYKHFQNLGRDDLTCNYLMKGIKLEIKSPSSLARIVNLLEQIPLNQVEETSTFFETLLKNLMINDHLYENYTSPSICRLMVELVEPNPGDLIGDPACGTGGLLSSALSYITDSMDSSGKSKVENTSNIKSLRQCELNRSSADTYQLDDYSSFIHGYDSNLLMMRITLVDLMMHGISNPRIECTDMLTLGHSNVRLKNVIAGYFDVVLCDPPNRILTDKNNIDLSLVEQAGFEKIELLFLAHSLRMLKEQGRIAMIVPDEFLFSESSQLYKFRKQVVEEHELQAVVSIPKQSNEWAFRGKSSILVLKKGGNTKNVFFYDLALDRMATPQAGAYRLSKFDVTNCIEKFNSKGAPLHTNKTNGEFYVTVDEIKKSKYVISYNRYVEMVYENEEIDPPDEILEDIKSLNKTIRTEITELEEVLK